MKVGYTWDELRRVLRFPTKVLDEQAWGAEWDPPREAGSRRPLETGGGRVMGACAVWWHSGCRGTHSEPFHW